MRPLSLLLAGAIGLLPVAFGARMALLTMGALVAFIAVPSLLAWQQTYLLMVALLPLTNVLVFDVGFTILPVYLLGILLLVREAAAGRLFKIPSSPVNIAIAAFYCAAIASTVAGILYRAIDGNQGSVEVGLRYTVARPVIQLGLLSLFCGLYLLSARFCGQRTRLDAFVRVYLWTSTIVACFALYQQLAYALNIPFRNLDFLGHVRPSEFQDIVTFGELAISRSNSTFGEPLFLGHFLLGPFSLCLGLLWSSASAPVLRPTLRLMTVLIFAGIVVSVSTGAYLGVTAVLLVLLATRVARRDLALRRVLPWLVVPMAGVLVASAVDASYLSAVSEKVTTSLGEELAAAEDARTFGVRRRDYWETAVQIYFDYPLFGLGLGGSGEEILRRVPQLRLLGGLNSVPLSILSEMGTAGIASFLAIVLVFARVTWRACCASVSADAALAAGFLAGFAGFLAQYGGGLGNARMDTYVWVFLGAAVAHSSLFHEPTPTPGLEK